MGNLISILQGRTYNGYMSLCAAINRTLDGGVDLVDPDVFGKLEEGELEECLKGDGGVPCPMMKERHQCLQSETAITRNSLLFPKKIILFSDASSVLHSKFGGSVSKLIESGEKSAQKLLSIIGQEFDCFRDEATLKDGTRVSFYKRAQGKDFPNYF